MDEVLKAVEKEDNGVSFMETLAMSDGMNNRNGLSLPDGPTSALISLPDVAMSSSAYLTAIAGGSKDSSAANADEVIQLKKILQDLQVIADSRDKMIVNLRQKESSCIKNKFNNNFERWWQ